MRITRPVVIAASVFSTLLYILIMNAVHETPFFTSLFGGADWTGAENDAGETGSWLAWLGLIAIPVIGYYSAQKLGGNSVIVQEDDNRYTDGQVSDPVWWKAIIGNVWLSVTWLPLRFVLGIYWLQAGWHKMKEVGWALAGIDPETGERVERGSSMAGFLERSYTPNPDTGRTSVAFGPEGWYADTLRYIVDNDLTAWLGPAIAWGEFLVGVGLLLGGLVGFAAFFATLLNMSFMLAGTTSSNPWMFGMTVFIILGWKVAGHYGLDRYLLPMLGTPWGRRQTDDNPDTRSDGRVASGHRT